MIKRRYMTSHLAYLSNRACAFLISLTSCLDVTVVQLSRHVFKPYTWKEGPLRPFTEYNGHLTSSRIPLSAFVDGNCAFIKS